MNEELKENEDDSKNESTAYSIMEFLIEDDCSEWADYWNMPYSYIMKFNQNRSEIVTLANKGALPEVAIDWIKQLIKLDDRVSKSNYYEHLKLKTELTVDEYCNLEKSINTGAVGISMKKIIQLTNKDEMTIKDVLFSECYLTVADHNPHQLLMQDSLDMYLIPLVDERNRLTGEFKVKYLFTAEALSAIAEIIDEYVWLK